MVKLKNIPAWQLTKVKNKSELIAEARNKGHTVQFASFMDLCHLKNSELEPQFQKYKGRVVLRGDIVKDDSGSYAVCTEQGSSASHMAAAEVLDVISRLPGCAGQAADAVSAKTQVKMEDAPYLMKIPKWTISKYRKETKFGSNVGNPDERSWLGRTNIIPWPCLFGLHSKRMQNKQRYCGQLQRCVCESRMPAGGVETLPYSEKSEANLSSGSYDMEGHANEMRGKILLTCKQIDSTITQSRNSMYWRPSIQRRRNRICWRIVKSIRSNCPEMLILGSNWQNWYFCGQWTNVPGRHEVDESMRQTLGTFDFLHSSHKWKQTKSHVGNTAQQCRLGFLQDSDFCGWLRRFEINIGRNLVHFWKSHVRVKKLDV